MYIGCIVVESSSHAIVRELEILVGGNSGGGSIAGGDGLVMAKIN